MYGDKASVEWPLIEHEPLVIHEGETPRREHAPDFAHLLPEPIRPFTTRGVYDAAEHTHLSFKQGSGHGGSHPHLAHEFLRSIVEGRRPSVDEQRSANWTAVGLCAHASAMQGGVAVDITRFS